MKIFCIASKYSSNINLSILRAKVVCYIYIVVRLDIMSKSYGKIDSDAKEEDKESNEVD